MLTGNTLQAIPAVELVTLCCDEGNALAWDEFINRFHRQISIFTFRESRSYKFKDSDISELIQETYVRLLSNNRKVLKDFRGNTEPAVVAYLITIVRSVVADQIRKETSQKRSALEISLNTPLSEDQEITIADLIPAGENVSPERILNEKITIHRLKTLLRNALSGANVHRDMIIFYLHVINGLSCREIAEMPNISLTTTNVQAIVFRTKERLREILGKKDADVM